MVSTAVDLSAVARVVGIKTTFKDLRGGRVVYLPQRVAVFGQGNSDAAYSTDKQELTSAAHAAQLYGYGSPLHLAARQLLPANGDGVGSIPVTAYPLAEAPSALPATGEITVTGSQTSAAAYYVFVNNIRSQAFTIQPGATADTVYAAIADAINSVLEMPVKAVASGTSVGLTSKWAGQSANAIRVRIDGPTSAGTTFAITQPSGGAANPTVDEALAKVGNVWESMLLNCLDIDDSAALDAFEEFGVGRWGALTRKPCVAFTGNTATTLDAATAVSDARRADRVNSQLVAPGSDDLPFVVAARQLARVVTVANNNPARDYGSLDASGLTPGADGVQWDYPTRDKAVKRGSSTVEVKDGVVNLSDIVTFYHPEGDPIPAYRYVCDIVKLQNIIFNLDLEFARPAWDGAPLIPDDQPTSNPAARKPKSAVAAIHGILDSLGAAAIIADVPFAKENTFAAISEQNPKRLDARVTLKLGGNSNIISTDLEFGFHFGTAPVVG